MPVITYKNRFSSSLLPKNIKIETEFHNAYFEGFHRNLYLYLQLCTYVNLHFSSLSIP